MQLKAFFLLGVIALAACSNGGGGGSAGTENTGNNQVTTQAIQVGEAYQVTLNEDEEKKRFSVPLQIGSSYSVRVINREESSGIVTVKLLETTLSESLSPGRVATFDHDALLDDELVLEVEGTSSSFYRFTIQVFPSTDEGLAQDSGFEPNDSRNAAYPMISGGEYTSYLGLYDDVDWFSLETVSNDLVSLHISNDPTSNSRLVVQLFDDFGDPLSQQFIVSHTEDLNEQITALESGKLFVSVKGQSRGTDHTYSISMSIEGVSN
ncbi:hypothetical protein [Teredinibacter turnerae]|uniref:hypothetical protein n=1 Tax=Teredinibacter turnerae TaxID=2426 RepID=UPI0003702187|nr:hypothetical protein [Teredinibacter turnerae]